MPDFLARRGATWYFVRRVPGEYGRLDLRGVIRHSTRILVADDRLGRRAGRAALVLNEELERYWRMLSDKGAAAHLSRYNEVRRKARDLGFDYIENGELIGLPVERRLERLETLASKGLVHDGDARAALLGTISAPSFGVSRLFEEYEIAVRDEIRDFSPEQLRIWRNGRIRAVEQFVKVVGDKPVAELSANDAIDYSEWWRERVIANGIVAKSANKDMGQLSRMLKELSIRRRLNLPDIFKGLRLRGETDKSRPPFETAFVRTRLLGGGLDGLNDEARSVLYVMVETGMRPSEIVNLTSETIILNVPIPHVRILADGRRLKTEDSERDIPLVGVALAALRSMPNGFPKYRGKATVLSATVNKYLSENGLRPTRDHTVYSLRHSFKDRLVAAEAPDSLIDSLMGHKTYKPKYGKGPSLDLKLKYLEKIAHPVPSCLEPNARAAGRAMLETSEHATGSQA